MSDFLNFRTAKSQLNTLYGVSISDDEFDELGLYAWDQINNKRYQMCVYKAKANEDGYIELPCNIDGEDYIEAVLSENEDTQISNGSPGFNFINQIIESYTEAYKSSFAKGHHKLYHRGTLVNYEYLGDRLKIQSQISNIYILYKGLLVDEDGLPFINKKERDAISTFCAYVFADKSAFGSKDKNQEYFAQKYEKRWKEYKAKAKSPISISQNEMDRCLDVTSRWDRKRYNIGYKPLNR